MVLNAKRWRLDTTSDQSAEEEEEEVDVLEPWATFLKRTARWTEQQLKDAGQREWLVVWRMRQWRWANKLATLDVEKWSNIATLWQPLVHSRHPCGRAQSRPRKRWDHHRLLGTAISQP